MSEATVSQGRAERPRIENGKQLLIAGLRASYTRATMNDIPAQWQRFAGYIGTIPGQVANTTYGLCFNANPGAPGIEYLTGVKVSGRSGLPKDLVAVEVPAQRYAIFLHREHVSKLRDTLDAITRSWLRESGHEVARASAGAPDFFERYTEQFDPRTGMGGVELWIPIKS